MEIKEFKFFHGVTLYHEGIQNIIRTLRARLEMENEENFRFVNEAENYLNRIYDEIINLDENR